jgi:5-formyltetrahydrofolate cyclo-ligase
MNIRDIFFLLRHMMPAEDRIKADRKITDSVLTKPEWKKAETVCLYMSTPDEVDTKPLLAAALSAGKTVVFPSIERDELVLHQIRSIRDFTPGVYRILEPKKTTPRVDTKSVDLCIVPGIVFDQDGYRLGHGKGYYDRLLSRVSAPKFGLAYEIQMVAKLDHTSYDVPMTVVVTEK